jgi:hypothetical protein
MSLLPEQCAVAFKEWSEICQVLADGRQTLIIRKGGIREGPGGFSPHHLAFWLFPTYVHQAQQGLRDRELDRPGDTHSAADPVDPVSIRALAVVERLWHIHSETELLALMPFHIWNLETLRRRFAYRQPGLWVLGVRVFRQDQPWTLTPTAEQLGCKSWVLLDSPLSTVLLRPALDHGAWAEQIGRVRDALGPGDDAGPRGTPA